MKTLLGIINKPEESKDFIMYVSKMAMDMNANAYFLHAQNPNSYPLGTPGSTGVVVAQVRQNLEEYAETAKRILAKHVKEVKSNLSEDMKIEYSSVLGDYTTLAKKLVAEYKVDMVIVEGAKDEGLWAHGTNIMEVVENVECPIWVIPKTLEYTPFNKIIYATDYKEEDIDGLKKLIALTSHFKPDITALHITDNVDFEEKVRQAGFIEILKSKLKYNNLDVKVLNNKNHDLGELLNEYAMLFKADLIVVLKENQSFFERIFKSDHAKEIIKKSMVPVLELHETE